MFGKRKVGANERREVIEDGGVPITKEFARDSDGQAMPVSQSGDYADPITGELPLYPPVGRREAARILTTKGDIAALYDEQARIDAAEAALAPDQPNLMEAVGAALDDIQSAQTVTIIERYDAIYVESLRILTTKADTLEAKIAHDSEELRQTQVAIAAAKAARKALGSEPEPAPVKRGRGNLKAVQS